MTDAEYLYSCTYLNPNLIKLKYIQTSTKIRFQLLKENLAAHVTSLAAYSESGINIASCLAKDHKRFSLQITLKASLFSEKPTPRQAYYLPNLTIDLTKSNVCHDINFMEYVISADDKFWCQNG